MTTNNYKNVYHIDDIVLSQFCTNTNRVLDKTEKYVLFKKHLHSFHNIESIYEDSLESYTSYIMQSILKNSFELKKNILKYEQYFYNIINGFAQHKGYKISAAIIARYWTNLLTNYQQILVLTQDPEILEIKFFFKELYTTRFINITPVNNNYYSDTFIRIQKVNGTYLNIVLIPWSRHNHLLSNYVVLSLIHKYSVRDALMVLRFDLETGNFSMHNVMLNDVIKNKVKRFIEKDVVDFSAPSISNCTFCPLKQCSVDQLFSISLPTPLNKIKRIRVQDI